MDLLDTARRIIADAKARGADVPIAIATSTGIGITAASTAVLHPHPDVRFVFKEPWPDFPAFYGTFVTSAGWVVPKKYVERVGEEAALVRGPGGESGNGIEELDPVCAEDEVGQHRPRLGHAGLHHLPRDPRAAFDTAREIAEAFQKLLLRFSAAAARGAAAVRAGGEAQPLRSGSRNGPTRS